MQNPFLIGPTLYLRPLEVEDARAVQPWFNDPEVRRFLARYRHMTLAEEEVFLRKLAEGVDNVVLGVVVRATDKLVGTAGLHQIDHRTRQSAFGISLGDKEAWGHGYGTEATRLVLGHAFEALNLNRVWLHVYEYNPRAVHVYEKVGFRHEGRLRQAAFHDGRYWDTLDMGLLRAEWQANHEAGT
ncbi:MAG TPA: GNAT family protein [Gemmataceae bacterium]|nr:GNAT family protein [Gemmataceae bacterium]